MAWQAHKDDRMLPVQFEQERWMLHGRRGFLRSGEFHYFRVPREDWRRRMRLFREAGGNCLATYIPWLIHEPIEGDFAFDRGDGATDLTAFLEAAAAEGLYVLVRPGPYQYSELIYGGLPRWLCPAYPRMLALRADGQPIFPDAVSYLHPLFLEKARKYFAEVCQRVVPFSVAHGGPVALAQPDNETGGFHLWRGSMDFNPETMGFGLENGRYARFLAARHGDVNRVNALYAIKVESLAQVDPRAFADDNSRAAQRSRKDYLDFYCQYLAEYLGAIMDMLENLGLRVPFVHNSASPEMNALFLESARRDGRRLLIGSDHYYCLDQQWDQNNPTPQYAIRVLVSCQMLECLGYPPTVLELPAGSCSDWPPMLPQDLKACYLTNVACGMKGYNYYVFTGGRNPGDVGHNGDLYDYGAAIGADGDVRPLYHVQKELAEMLQTHDWLQEARDPYDYRVGFWWDMARAKSFERPVEGVTEPLAGMWRFLERGILTTGFCAGLAGRLVDLADASLLNDLKTPLWIPAGSSMPRVCQERIVEFLRAGGKAVIGPVAPHLDEHYEPLTTLADALDMPRLCNPPMGEGTVRLCLGEARNIFVKGRVYLAERLGQGASVLGVDERSGQAFAWAKDIGACGGQAVFLGLRWLHSRNEHRQMMRHVLGELGVAPRLDSSNPNVWLMVRSAPGRSALFALNLHSSPQQVSVRWRVGSTSLDTGLLQLGPMSVAAVIAEDVGAEVRTQVLGAIASCPARE